MARWREANGAFADSHRKWKPWWLSLSLSLSSSSSLVGAGKSWASPAEERMYGVLPHAALFLGVASLRSLACDFADTVASVIAGWLKLNSRALYYSPCFATSHTHRP